jgi:hypothetical protein
VIIFCIFIVLSLWLVLLIIKHINMAHQAQKPKRREIDWENKAQVKRCMMAHLLSNIVPDQEFMYKCLLAVRDKEKDMTAKFDDNMSLDENIGIILGNLWDDDEKTYIAMQQVIFHLSRLEKPKNS